MSRRRSAIAAVAGAALLTFGGLAAASGQSHSPPPTPVGPPAPSDVPVDPSAPSDVPDLPDPGWRAQLRQKAAEDKNVTLCEHPDRSVTVVIVSPVLPGTPPNPNAGPLVDRPPADPRCVPKASGE